MKQYIDLCKKIINEGEWVYNERTGKRCLTIINADLEYDPNPFPVLTTKKTAWKPAIAEMLGYLRGYSSAKQFRELGTNTWTANANENEAWLNNPFRKGEDDMGEAYRFRESSYWQLDSSSKFLVKGSVDQYKEIVEKLSEGIDDRRLIMTAWQPHKHDRACLPACMHTHTFSLLKGTLHLTSYQRSIDVPLGLPFNIIQCAWLLKITAQITGHKVGKVFHKLVNVHVYEDQLELLKEQIKREPYHLPALKIDSNINTLEDLETWVTLDHFELVGYQSHPAIKFPFSV